MRPAHGSGAAARRQHPRLRRRLMRLPPRLLPRRCCCRCRCRCSGLRGVGLGMLHGPRLRPVHVGDVAPADCVQGASGDAGRLGGIHAHADQPVLYRTLAAEVIMESESSTAKPKQGIGGDNNGHMRLLAGEGALGGFHLHLSGSLAPTDPRTFFEMKIRAGAVKFVAAGDRACRAPPPPQQQATHAVHTWGQAASWQALASPISWRTCMVMPGTPPPLSMRIEVFHFLAADRPACRSNSAAQQRRGVAA
jgi:hypothetical protein